MDPDEDTSELGAARRAHLLATLALDLAFRCDDERLAAAAIAHKEEVTRVLCDLLSKENP